MYAHTVKDTLGQKAGETTWVLQREALWERRASPREPLSPGCDTAKARTTRTGSQEDTGTVSVPEGEMCFSELAWHSEHAPVRTTSFGWNSAPEDEH